MSAHHLPEDLRRWPRDPYQILNVGVRCDPLEVRKAYARLIRHFNPEQFPEHFRLLREAYEAVKRETRFFGGLDTDIEEDDDFDPTLDHGPPQTSCAREETPFVCEPDQLNNFWEMACNGQDEEAYARLRELHEGNPRSSELPARLYGMLLAHPELDPDRTPCDWLIRGLRTEGPWGPCRQLYRREIDDRPQEALSHRFTELLGTVALSENLVELLEWRWGAAKPVQTAELITADLAQLAPRIEGESEEAWVRVLLKAADYLAWNSDTEYGDLGQLCTALEGQTEKCRSDNQFDKLCKDIDSRVHLHATFAEELARLDFLRDLVGNAGNLLWVEPGAKVLLEVLPMTWTSPFENRHRILKHCRWAAERPEVALQHLDEVQRLAPLVLPHLHDTLAWLWLEPEDPRDDETLFSIICDKIGGVGPTVCETDYELYRQHLLRLCITEVIAPETVVNIWDGNSSSFGFQRVHEDWPLRTVCLAHRLILA